MSNEKQPPLTTNDDGAGCGCMILAVLWFLLAIVWPVICIVCKWLFVTHVGITIYFVPPVLMAIGVGILMFNDNVSKNQAKIKKDNTNAFTKYWLDTTDYENPVTNIEDYLV